MNTHDEHKNNENDLRQQLLELHYGCHEDPAALEARLATDPELRKLFLRVPFPGLLASGQGGELVGGLGTASVLEKPVGGLGLFLGVS